MRERIAEFDYLLQHAGRDEDRTALGEDTLAGERARAVGRIGSLRDEARRRLSESVAALENLRVDLLRLQAGTVRLDSVTTKLGRARDLAEQVDRLLESQLEVEELLS